jgi:hypothetical protein
MERMPPCICLFLPQPGTKQTIVYVLDCSMRSYFDVATIALTVSSFVQISSTQCSGGYFTGFFCLCSFEQSNVSISFYINDHQLTPVYADKQCSAARILSYFFFFSFSSNQSPITSSPRQLLGASMIDDEIVTNNNNTDVPFFLSGIFYVARWRCRH